MAPHAVGIVAVIWQQTDDLRRDSELPGLTVAQLFGELDWTGDYRALLDALIDTGWLEEHETRLYSYAGWPEKHWFSALDPEGE